MKTRIKAAVGYVRVSIEGQAQNGVSLDAQRDRIQAWANLNGFTLAAVHVDQGISGGKLTNRPAAHIPRQLSAHATWRWPAMDARGIIATASGFTLPSSREKAKGCE